VPIVDQEDSGIFKPGDEVTFTDTMGTISNERGVSVDVKGSFNNATDPFHCQNMQRGHSALPEQELGAL
jgi:hypothetical protein